MGIVRVKEFEEEFEQEEIEIYALLRLFYQIHFQLS